MVADSGYPSDTGVVGSGLGEYVLESIVVNAQARSAEMLHSFTITIWNLLGLGGFAGGSDGMDYCC